ncbi:probable penicillin-binding protein 2 [Desulfotalea psychrophila LSv54]|uniref:Probable penicillin-binding protein 2 n=2 Tax=Desulfotalea psychrophila TaxID=84980 RepID=Q6APB2_DESPS|nr:probable penicillin-binding protein 2 [Desulfotalea psychrophila LSv54]
MANSSQASAAKTFLVSAPMKSSNKRIENLSKVNLTALDFLRNRIYVPAGIIVVFFVLIMLRLWNLQVINGDYYAQRAESNRVRERQIAPPRGSVFDRNGTEIVSNRPSFNVVLIREGKGDVGKVLERIAPILDETVTDLWGRVRQAKKMARYEPIVLKKDVDWETLAYLENHNYNFSGVRIEVQPVRVYHYQDLAANVIGYLGSISKKSLEKSDHAIYRGGDIVGKSGMEKLREADLRGQKGQRISEVNAKGFEQRLLNKIEPLPGKDVYLTIDAGLQQTAEALMDASHKAGAVVVMEVKTGRILVAASTPSIHLEDFIGGISQKNWAKLRDNTERTPLINKVVQANYPPGSVYKMVTAMAALAEGIIDSESTIYCPGSYHFGNRRYGCWKRSGHGDMNLKQALAQSCDVYFYQLGERLGVDKLAEYAKKFGLGSRSGIEMEHEKGGLIPTMAWKKRVKKRRWQDGETLSVAIGQGFNLTTPLQICLMTSMLATHGKLYKPQLVEKVVDSSGLPVETFHPILLQELKGLEKYFDMIQVGMEEVVQGKRGTGRRSRIKGIDIAGKTGSAQVVHLSKSKGMKDNEIPYKERDHAWFTGFAPADNPEIAITVLVEHGLHGGSVAGPVARGVLKEYFRDRLQAAKK